MGPLIAKIIADFKANTILSAVDGPYLDQRPEKLTTFPSAILKIMGSNKRDHMFGGEFLQDVHIRLSIFHTSMPELIPLHEEVSSEFEWKREAMTKGTIANGSLLNDTVGKALGLYSDNHPIYLSINEYVFRVEDHN